MDNLVPAPAPIVIGAVVAGISALLKSAVERRDARFGQVRLNVNSGWLPAGLRSSRSGWR